MKTWFSLSILLNILGIAGILFLVWWMGGISNLWARIVNRGLTKEYFMLKDQYAKLPQDSTAILFLGNSLTYGGAWQEWMPNYTSANRGIPGDGIEGLMERMPAYSGLNPEIVVVMIGINDLAFHPKEWLLQRYPAFLRQLESDFSGAKIVLQSILPVNNDVSNTGLSNLDINAVNEELKRLSTANTIYWLDLAPEFKDANDQLKSEWTDDGLHLKGAAYQFWAAKLEQLIKSLK